MRLRMRIAVGLLAVGFIFGTVAVEANAALSVKRAREAAYKLTRKVGIQNGASYALAGHCKRRSRNKVRCWGAIIFADGSAAAQRIIVKKKGKRVRARRYGRVYEGSLTDDGGSSGGGSDQWAVCTSGGFCVGS